jgi:ATP-dependent protease ClpP protease subunit
MHKQAKNTLIFLLALLFLAVSIRVSEALKEKQEPTNTFYIIHEIDDGEYHQKIERTLLNAKKGDRILINIDSPGGHSDMSIRISAAILKTKATVTCKVGKMAASGAAIILASCHKVEIPNDSYILFHTVRTPDIFGNPIFYNDPILTPTERDYLIKLILGAKEKTTQILTKWQTRAIYIYNLDIWMSGEQYKEQICKLANRCEWNRKIIRSK